MKQPNGPQFIVFDGVPGAGKTTQIKRVANILRQRGIDVVITREFGNGSVYEYLREELDTPYGTVGSPNIHLLRMFADRQVHLDMVIRPALAKGQWVLCDRFINTSYAYQVEGGGGDAELFFLLTAKVVELTIPDLTVVIDVPDTVSKERSIRCRSDSVRHTNNLPGVEQTQVNVILRRFAEYDKHVLVDGDQSMEAVTQAIIATLDAQFNLNETAA